jgi:hypothetical protein
MPAYRLNAKVETSCHVKKRGGTEKPYELGNLKLHIMKTVKIISMSLLSGLFLLLGQTPMRRIP